MYWSALLIGLAGGLHCAGMCSPLALAITSNNPFIGSKILYNLGRILTYSMMGIAVGQVGYFIGLAGYQNFFAYLAGGMLLLLGFGAINGIRIPILTDLINRFSMFVKNRFGSFLKQKRNIFFLGMLNGILPCGLTYLALTYTLTLENAWQGGLFMLLFGMGTIPIMFGLIWFMGVVIKRINLNYRKVSMGVMIILGSLLVGRALFNHTPNSSESDINTTSEVICR